jgi:signal peptidase II
VAADPLADVAATGSADPGAAGVPNDPAPVRDEQPARRGKSQIVLLAVVAAVVLLIDTVSKALIVAHMAEGQSIRLLGGIVYLSLIRNPGAAFSMATGMTWVLAIIAIGVVVVIIRMAPRLRSPIWAVCLGLILGGALGNLMDRIFRAPGVLRGHVVDFISVFGPDARYFPVFNLADSAITIGGVLLVITTLIGIDFDGHRVPRGRHAQSRAPEDPSGTPQDPRGTGA